MKILVKNLQFHLGGFLLCMIAGFLAAKGACASVDGEHLFLEYLGERLSLSAENAPLKDIFSEIHEKTGLEYDIPTQYLGRGISIRIRSLPLEIGIQRILRGLSYACVMRNGKLAKVIVVPEGKKPQQGFPERPGVNEDPMVETDHYSIVPPTVQEVVAAMNAGEIDLPDEIAAHLEAMEGVSYSEAMKMAEQIQITPFQPQVHNDAIEAGPSLEEIEQIIGSMPEEF